MGPAGVPVPEFKCDICQFEWSRLMPHAQIISIQNRQRVARHHSTCQDSVWTCGSALITAMTVEIEIRWLLAHLGIVSEAAPFIQGQSPSKDPGAQRRFLVSCGEDWSSPEVPAVPQKTEWLWMALVGSASDTLAVTDDGHLWPTTSSKVLLEFDHIVTAALVFIGCMHICLFCKGFTCKREICEWTAGSVKWWICERTAAATFKHHLFLSDSRIILQTIGICKGKWWEMTNIYKYERKKMSCGAGKPLLYLKF